MTEEVTGIDLVATQLALAGGRTLTEVDLGGGGVGTPRGCALEVRVNAEIGDGVVEITAEAETVAQTGVEMEALVAASVAALTVYDMAKAIDKEMVVEEIRLVEKTKEPV